MRHVSAVDPTRFFAKYGENDWAGLKGYLDEIARTAAALTLLSWDDYVVDPDWIGACSPAVL